MGWRDRPYARHDFDRQPPRQFGGMTMGLPRPGRVVKYLLIVNVAVFFLQIFFGDLLVAGLAVVPAWWWQVWRYVTFQFLHGDPIHLLFNMLGLYFLGMALEDAWGPRRFLWFYLGCGVAAGAAHVLIAVAWSQAMWVSLLGASGGVYGVVLACAVLFPQIRVMVFLFFMPIRAAAALFFAIAIYSVLMGLRDGAPLGGGISHVAHLGGAAAAAAYLWLWPVLRGRLGLDRLTRRPGGAGAWQRRAERRRREDAKVDRILAKIHRDGLESLSWFDRRTLRRAADRKRRENRDLP